MPDLNAIYQDLEARRASLNRILVIDDQENCYLLFKHYSRGRDVVWTERAKVGLSILERDQTFGAVIVDQNLPDIPGHEVYKIVESTWPDLLVFLSTDFKSLDPVIVDEIAKIPLIRTLPKPLDYTNVDAVWSEIER